MSVLANGQAEIDAVPSCEVDHEDVPSQHHRQRVGRHGPAAKSTPGGVDFHDDLAFEASIRRRNDRTLDQRDNATGTVADV